MTIKNIKNIRKIKYLPYLHQLPIQHKNNLQHSECYLDLLIHLQLNLCFLHRLLLIILLHRVLQVHHYQLEQETNLNVNFKKQPRQDNQFVKHCQIFLQKPLSPIIHNLS